MSSSTETSEVVVYLTSDGHKKLFRLGLKVHGLRWGAQSRVAMLFLEWAGRKGIDAVDGTPGDEPVHLRLGKHLSGIKTRDLGIVLSKAISAYVPHSSTVPPKDAETRLITLPRYDVDQLFLLSLDRQAPFGDTLAGTFGEAVRTVYADVVPRLNTGSQDVEILIPKETAKLYDEIDSKARKIGWDADTLISNRIRSSYVRRAA
jgi:hypothetical protein